MDEIDKEIAEKLKLLYKLSSIFGPDKNDFEKMLRNSNDEEKPLQIEVKAEKPVVIDNRFSALKAKLAKTTAKEDTNNAEDGCIEP